MAGHSPECEKADPGSLCDCDCAGARHAVRRTKGGVPAAGAVSRRAQKAAARENRPATVNRLAEPAKRAPKLADLDDDALADALITATSTMKPNMRRVDAIAAEMDRRDAAATAASAAKTAKRDPLAGVDLGKLSDGALLDLWVRHDNDPDTADKIGHELDRRDQHRGAQDPGHDPDTAPDTDRETAGWLAQADTDAYARWQAADKAGDADAAYEADQARINTAIAVLVAEGDDYIDAFAKVMGGDADKLHAQDKAAGVDAQRRAGETRNATVARLHTEWVALEYIAAENAHAGHLLSPAGKAAGVDPRDLWGGTTAAARKYASEELKRWWQDHPRKTLTEFRADLLGRDTDRAAAKKARGQGNGRDFGL